MPSIHLRGLTYAHTTAVDILTRVDLDVSSVPAGPATWVGVVGANGAGKSTLLHLVAGLLSPASGSVHVVSGRPPVLLRQEVDRLPDDVAEFVWRWDGPAAQLRSRLDLDDHLDEERWLQLSPGQRLRWRLAAVLVEEPDVLLLDEPTNHLDAHGRRALLDALDGFRGLGLVTSHDRLLLDELTTATIRVHAGNAELHAGPYTEASARWRADEQLQRERRASARRTAARERRHLGDLRRERHSIEAAAKREARHAGHRDSDARETGRVAARAKAEAALGARVAQQRSRLARAAAAVDDVGTVSRDHRGAVELVAERTGRSVLAAVRGEVHHGGGEVLLADVDVAIEAGQHVHVHGVNGAGKTTLVRRLLADAAARDVVTAVLPQELADPASEVDRVRALPPDRRGRVLGIATKLGVDPDRVLTSDAPSPGEARKLAMSRLLADAASMVVLDEPTNHLDLPAIEALEEALAGFAGTLVLVTHDEVLAAATTDVVWVVADGTVRMRDRDGRPAAAL